MTNRAADDVAAIREAMARIAKENTPMLARVGDLSGDDLNVLAGQHDVKQEYGEADYALRDRIRKAAGL